MIFADRYKMASIQCEGRQIEITTDHALDVDDLIYISGVTVTIGTTSKDSTVTYQTNTLTLRKLTSVRTALSLSFSLSFSLSLSHSLTLHFASSEIFVLTLSKFGYPKITSIILNCRRVLLCCRFSLVVD